MKPSAMHRIELGLMLKVLDDNSEDGASVVPLSNILEICAVGLSQILPT